MLPPRLLCKLDQLLHPSLPTSLLTFHSLPDLLSTHALLLTSSLLSSSRPRPSPSPLLPRLLSSSLLSPRFPPTLPYSLSLFSSLPAPSLSAFNTLIRFSSRSPPPSPLIPLHLYKQLLRARIVPDRLTFPFLLKSCSSLAAGRSLHSHAIQLGLEPDAYVLNTAISMYSSLGDVPSARKMFDRNLGSADVVSWTAIISAYCERGMMGDARLLFDRAPERNPVTWNAMVGGFARAGRREDARAAFDEMPRKNAASWGSMVSGFARSGLCADAVAAFREMLGRGVPPNEATLVSAASACAQLRSPDHGDLVYRYAKGRGLEASVILSTVFVDMYGKCGNVRKAVRVFCGMPVKNVYTWNSMISGLANNGHARKALALFWKMKLFDIQPNDVTFIGLLSACSHSGMVDKGRWFFDTMTGFYKIRPSEEHYGCVVDLLARAGMIKEAVEFMDGMPVEPHPGLLGAIAGACRTHGELGLGEEMAKRLIELEPEHGGRYVLLANIYAAARRWDDMEMVRRMLKERRVSKVAGNSLVELKSVGDESFSPSGTKVAS